MYSSVERKNGRIERLAFWRARLSKKYLKLKGCRMGEKGAD
jgi:hypothetical protein